MYFVNHWSKLHSHKAAKPTSSVCEPCVRSRASSLGSCQYSDPHEGPPIQAPVCACRRNHEDLYSFLPTNDLHNIIDKLCLGIVDNGTCVWLKYCVHVLFTRLRWHLDAILARLSGKTTIFPVLIIQSGSISPTAEHTKTHKSQHELCFILYSMFIFFLKGQVCDFCNTCRPNAIETQILFILTNFLKNK